MIRKAHPPMRHILLGIALLVLIGVASSGFMLIQNSSQELDAKSFREQLLSIESLASEARLLATQRQENKVTSSFTKSHAEDLSEQVKTQKQTLQKSSAKQNIAKQKNEAVALSDQLYSNLVLLQKNPDDTQNAKDVSEKLEQVSIKLGEIHSSIKL